MSNGLCRDPAKQEISSMIILVVLSVAPHFLHLNPWVIGFFLGMLLPRYLLLKRGDPKVHPFFIFVLTLSALATVTISYSFLSNRRFGVALLVVMVGLKIFELARRRDHYVTIFVCLFTLITQFLFNQSMSITVYVVFVVIGLIAQQQSISRHHPAILNQSNFRLATSMLLQAIPVAIVLFVFFPLFNGLIRQNLEFG